MPADLQAQLQKHLSVLTVWIYIIQTVQYNFRFDMAQDYML